MSAVWWDLLRVLGIVLVVVLIGGFFALLIGESLRRHDDREWTQARAQAQYNKFLELLRDVKWNLLNRNCW